MFEDSGCRDLYAELLEQFGAKEREPTYGDNALARYEAQSIDYIFSFDHIGRYKLRKITIDSVEVLKQPKGEEFSDHWGIKMKLSM